MTSAGANSSGHHAKGAGAAPIGSRILEAVTLHWGVRPVQVQLISNSENDTYRVDLQDGSRFVLRLHRPGYQSRDAIESELAWLDALQNDSPVRFARPVTGTDGRGVQSLDLGGVARHAVLFEYAQGREPLVSEDLVWLFGVIGEMAAHLHRHAASWNRPKWFTRPVLDNSTILPASGPWGDWRAAPDLQREYAEAIAAMLPRLDDDLRRYGQAGDRFGLIHGDMRLGNLLVSDREVTLIDFDDAGFGWFGYDFAAAVSFHETHPKLGDWRESWLDAYRQVRTLEAEDVRMLDAMVLLRRMALLAWIGSHAETDLAARHCEGFAQGTATLAERYLAQGRIV